MTVDTDSNQFWVTTAKESSLQTLFTILINSEALQWIGNGANMKGDPHRWPKIVMCSRPEKRLS